MDKINRELRFENRQFKSLSKAQSKPRYYVYPLVLFAIIVLVDMLDNITTNTNGNITSCFINEFFVFGKGMSYEEGFSLHNSYLIVTYAFGLITPFYKSLGDKYGRKLLFLISTIGMASGLIVIFFCQSYLSFMIGNCITAFFLGHDIQILYVLEEAPSKHRAKVYSVIKGLGCLGSLFVPLLRETVMHNDDSLWRNIFILPGLAGLLFALFVFLFVRESKVFLSERLAYLSLPEEERRALLNEKARLKADKKAKRAREQKEHESGIIPAIRYIFHDKQLRTLLCIKCVFDIAILAVQNYESILHLFNYTTAEISKAEYFFPVFYAVSLLVSGFMADKIGRKKTILTFGFVTLITFGLFVILSGSHTSPYVVGILYGLYLGGYWIGRDYMEIMATEMVPTGIRASVIGAFGLLVYVGMAIGMALNIILPLFMPIWLATLIIAAPSIMISVILLLVKIKETKGVDYDSIVFSE